MNSAFEIVGSIQNQERIAVGKRLRELARLEKRYGRGRWRKLKGTALIRFGDGTLCFAELHWYELSGLGRREVKIKRLFGRPEQ